MTVYSDWLEDCRHHLDGNRPQEVNTVATTYTAPGATIVMTYELGNIAAGAIITIGTSIFKVLSVNTGTKTATVIPSFGGSTAVNAAVGALVRVNPRFSDFRILRAINDHLSTLSSPTSGLYAVGTKTLTYQPTVEGYELTSVTGLQRVLEVRRRVPGPELGWPRVRADRWDVYLSAPTADFASGLMLRLREGSPGQSVQVVYAKSFTTSTTTTDNVTTTGIPATAEDVPPLGAAIRIMSGREVGRNSPTSQGDSRRAGEVPPGAVAASYRGLQQLWAQRVSEESARLRQAYPIGK